MPDEHLTPGFFGKLPSAGDFVGRNLPADFVRPWDRWTARHLASVYAEEEESLPALRFLLGPAAFGPLAGVVMASCDRAGRRFPLTLASPIDAAYAELPALADEWFTRMEAIGAEALDEGLDADTLAARLAAEPFPLVEGEGEPVDAMLFWTDPAKLVDSSWDAPGPAIDALLGTPLRAGVG